MAKDDFDDLTPIPRYRGRTVFRLTLLSILALAAAGVAGYYAWIYRAEVEASADELTAGRTARTELTKLKERYAELDSKVSGSETKLKEAETQVAGAKADLTATQEELETLRTQRAETEKRLAAFKELTDRFQKMIQAGKIEVKVRNGVPLMALPAEVLFPSGSAALSRPGELAVMEVGITLKQLPNRRFMVVGHTDNLPVKSATYKDNWELFDRARRHRDAVPHQRRAQPQDDDGRRPRRARPGHAQQDQGGPREEPPHRDHPDAGPRRDAPHAGPAGREAGP